MENREELQSATPPHPSAAQARIRRKKDAEDIGISADYIAAFVERFYGHIRNDAVLGPIFDTHISDWPAHLDNMKKFWRSVLYNSGEFSGNPMLKHIRIPGLDEAHFARWLALFDQTLRELEPHPEATRQVSERARVIAGSLLGGIKTQGHSLNIIAAPAREESTPARQDGFQLPRLIWAIMLASYGLFFASIISAVGRSGEARFVIVIAVCYALIFFGGTIALNRIAGPEKPSPLAQPGGKLQTWTGPLNIKEVASQVLIIPLCIAGFALVVLFVLLSVVP